MKKNIKITTMTELPYEEKIKKEYIDLVGECRKYHYRVENQFNYFYIYTKFEAWRYELTNGKRKLMHENRLFQSSKGKESIRWHRQKFPSSSSIKQIVTYIHEHEEWRYGSF